MNVQEACLLQIGQAQLLLYSMGARSVYGFVQAAELSRERALQLYADMVRNGILVPENNALAVQEPWRSCLAQWRAAQTAVRFHAAGNSLPDTCLYPGKETVLAVTPQQRRPEVLRLTQLPHDRVWDWLAEQYDLPPESPDTLLCEQAPPGAAQEIAQDMPGLLFLLEYVRPDGTAAERLAAVQRPLYRRLLHEQAGCVAEKSYRTDALQHCLQLWLRPEKEETP